MGWTLNIGAAPAGAPAYVIGPPSTPLNLIVTQLTPTSVSLSWNASNAGVKPIAGYIISRNGAQVGGPQVGLTFIDTGLTPGTQYTYTVAALDIVVASSANASVNATTPTVPGQVQGLTANAVSSSQINSAWTATPTATSYTIRRAGVVIASNVLITSYSDPGLTASTLYSYTVAAVNANGEGAQSAAASATTSGASSSLSAPRIAAFYTGGNFDYANATMALYMKHLHQFMFVFPDGRQQFIGYSAASFCNAAIAGSLVPSGLTLFSYYDPIVQNTGTAQAVQSAAKQLLMTAYPGGANVTTNGGANTVGNPAVVGAQPTCTVGTPPVARTPAVYQADASFDLCMNGGALGLTGSPVAANPAVHMYYDDFNPYTNYSGDWLRNGTSQSADVGATPPGSSAAGQAMRNGWAALCARLRVKKPGCLIISDFAGMYLSQGGQFSVLTGMQGVLNGGIMEALTGWVNSEDHGSWTSMMHTVQRAIAFSANASPQYIFFNHLNLTNDGRDFYHTTPYEALLYGFCSAMLLNTCYAPSPTGNAGNMDLTNVKGPGGNVQALPANYWFDEFCVNPTTLACYGYNDPNIGLGYDWAGTAIDDGDPVATTWSNGIHRKRYQMANGRIVWFLLNPPGNGAKTNVALGQRMQTLSGSQNPTVNSGNTNVTTITMPDSSGRILVSFP